MTKSETPWFGFKPLGFLSFFFFLFCFFFLFFVVFLFLFFLGNEIYCKNIVSVSLSIPLTKINHLTLKLIFEGSYLCIWKRCCTVILLKDIIMQQFKIKWSLTCKYCFSRTKRRLWHVHRKKTLTNSAILQYLLITQM